MQYNMQYIIILYAIKYYWKTKMEQRSHLSYLELIKKGSLEERVLSSWILMGDVGNRGHEDDILGDRRW